jgi:hypothetical protein
MIVDFDESYTYVLNLGRPDFTCDKHYEYWTEIFNLIETTDIKIMVNSLYRTMKEYCENKKGYLGGGFKFNFWFETESDLLEFAYQYHKISIKYDYHIVLNRERAEKYVSFLETKGLFKTEAFQQWIRIMEMNKFHMQDYIYMPKWLLTDHGETND